MQHNDNYVQDIENFKEYKDDKVNYFYEKTEEYQKKFKLKMTPGTIGHNDETDAFRHAFMQASLSFEYGGWGAELLGNQHEADSNKSPQMSEEQWQKEKNMDLWNNAIGREVAQEVKAKIKGMENAYTKIQIADMIAVAIRDKIKKGAMITNLDDKRDFKKSYYGGHIHTKEEIKKMKSKEFLMYEGGINKQAKEKGIPSEEELKTNKTQPALTSKNLTSKVQAEKQSTQKVSSKNSSSKGSSSASKASGGKSENGHWVTIDGNHVLIED